MQGRNMGKAKEFEAHQTLVVAKRMILEADDYLSDKDILTRKLNSSGRGATLLGLIGLEILLKALVLLETRKRPANHDFSGMFSELKGSTQRKLIGEAAERFAGHVDFSDMDHLLGCLRRAFEQGRYSYEVNDERSDEEARQAGMRWLKNGASFEEADIAFFPLELDALVFALRREIKRAIDDLQSGLSRHEAP